MIEGMNHDSKLQQTALKHLGTDAVDLELLRRAVHPDAFGLTREPLPWPQPGSPAAATICRLLRAGQVPTPGAVQSLLAQGTRAEHYERDKRWRAATIAVIRTNLRSLGPTIGDVVEAHWSKHNHGPTWRETIPSEPDDAALRRALAAFKETPISRDLCALVIGELHHRGWLASTSQRRSLRTGPTYRAHRNGIKRTAAVDPFGWHVACALGMFRAQHDDRSPSWEELAEFGRDPLGELLFKDAHDAHNNADALIAEGWLRIDEHGALRRGDGAKQYAQQRRERSSSRQNQSGKTKLAAN